MSFIGRLPWGYMAEREYIDEKIIFDWAARKIDVWKLNRVSSGPVWAGWRHLEWDAGIFGFSVARVEIIWGESLELKDYCNLFRLLYEDIERNKISYATCRVPANDVSLIQSAQDAGWRLVDFGVMFARKPESSSYSDMIGRDDYTIRFARGEDANAVSMLAEGIYDCDRFHSERLIGTTRADRVYREWLYNSCTGKAADAVIIAEVDSKPVGYYTCETIDIGGVIIGDIGLVGVKSAYRGKGIARRLTFEAMNWFKKRGCDFVVVGTQLGATDACRLYQNTGFHQVAGYVTLRMAVSDMSHRGEASCAE